MDKIDLKRRYLILLFFLSVISHASSSEEIGISPKIDRVTVFTDTALIRKSANVSLKKGENTIRIRDLTQSVIDGSVQVKMLDPSSVKISDVKVDQTYLQKQSDENIEKVRAKLAETEALIQAGTDDTAAITNSIDFLKRISPFPKNQKVLPSELEAHTKFLEKALFERYGRIAKLDTRLKELREEKALLEKELNRLKTPDLSKSVQVTLSCAADLKEQKLEISYLTQNARWTPLYTLRADSAEGKIEWSSFVSITQSSGEEWGSAEIEISTAHPFGTQAPDPIQAWYIDIYRPTPPSRAKALLFEADTMIRSSASAPMAEYETPTVNEETTSFSFLLPARHTIPSDNQPHKIFVAAATVKGDFHYRAVPKLSPYAYMSSEVLNPFSFPLLEGEMTLLLDGHVVGTYQTPGTLFPEEKIQLSFGADESIKIERKQNKKYTKETGLISHETHVEYDYTHEITNGKNKPVRIRVEDHFPISRNEQIRVTREAPKTGEADISSEGIITWDIELKPHAKKILPMHFSVSYPKEVRVEGLE
ncbi:mucoidy inhibitor MuiA family protein [Sulfuricurvum sp.]|uniref:mucoidy inhibitor MuiA family protein n=1 Tax=Sulfuricurvum sp. TaxID=2025608 RepID=UPI003C60C227